MLADACRLMRKQVDRRVKHKGLSRVQWLLLAHMERRPGSSLALLAERLQETKTALTRIVAEMERSGWVMHRAGGYYLTPLGLDVSAGVKAPALALLKQCFHGLSPERREAFMIDLSHIRANLLWMATDGDETGPETTPSRRRT